MVTKTVMDKQGRTITLVYDDYSTIRAYDGQVYIGYFEWDVVCTQSNKYGDDDCAALLKSIFLDKSPGYTNSGIGKEIVRMISDEATLPVVVRRDTGSTSEDGSHPTGNAPIFYGYLVKHGLAHWYP